MQHLILTKLAVGAPPVNWLARRLYIFEHFCAPSIAAQSSKSFRWVLAVGATTPDWFLNRVRQIAPAAILVRHVAHTLTPNWVSLVRPFVRDEGIITTRLDSDDMLHHRFVERVQDVAAQSVSDEVVDFPVGLQLRLPDYAFAPLAARLPTHFISLVERSRLNRSVYSFYHNQSHLYYPVRVATTAPSWVEICHDTNITNALKDSDRRGRLPYPMLMKRMLRD